MNPPTVYLIRRGLTEEKIQQLRDYLALTPLAAVIVTSLGDLDYARSLADEHAMAIARPIAIVGDFDQDFAELGDTTTWQTLPLPCRTSSV